MSLILKQRHIDLSHDYVYCWMKYDDCRKGRALFAAGADPFNSVPFCTMASFDSRAPALRETEYDDLNAFEKLSRNFCECNECSEMDLRTCRPCNVLLVIADEAVQQRMRERKVFLHEVLNEMPTDLQRLIISYLPFPQLDL